MKLRVPVTLSVAFVGATLAAAAAVSALPACGDNKPTADAPHECELFCIYVGPQDAGPDAGTDCGKCVDEYADNMCPADCEGFG